MAVNSKSQSDALYCKEEEETLKKERDILWDDEQVLHSLFSKERETSVTETEVSVSRKEGVEWILRVNSYHGFSALTALLAVNFLDRFLLLNFKKDKAWMIQLVALASLSLAAKLEETNVPLLLDLQVEDAKYLFEAKTIQRMELLILSALKWRMNAVTPLSFVDNIVRSRLRLKNYNQWEFLTRCENLILSLIADSRFVRYLPSVLAAATMLHIINQVEPSNAIEHQNHILGALKINKEEVEECYEQLWDVSLEGKESGIKHKNRKIGSIINSSSGGIMSSSDASNDSWEVAVAMPSSPHPILKKRRVEEQHMKKIQSYIFSVHEK